MEWAEGMDGLPVKPHGENFQKENLVAMTWAGAPYCRAIEKAVAQARMKPSRSVE